MSVYFIRDDRWIKIGVSVDPWTRRRINRGMTIIEAPPLPQAD